MVEQVLGQQTAENRESLLDNLIRQLQNEQDELQNAEVQAEEAEGMLYFTSRKQIIFVIFFVYLVCPVCLLNYAYKILLYIYFSIL